MISIMRVLCRKTFKFDVASIHVMFSELGIYTSELSLKSIDAASVCYSR